MDERQVSEEADDDLKVPSFESCDDSVVSENEHAPKHKDYTDAFDLMIGPRDKKAEQAKLKKVPAN